MRDPHKLIDDLKRTRDELRLQLHLGSKEAQAEWEQLEKQWHAFSAKADLEGRAGEFSSAVHRLGLDVICSSAQARTPGLVNQPMIHDAFGNRIDRVASALGRISSGIFPLTK